MGWLILGTGLVLSGFLSWSLSEAASLVPWLLVTIALHLYSKGRSLPFVLLAYVSAIWAAVIRQSSSSLYLYSLLAIHGGVSLYVLLRDRKQHEPLPLVWQALALYALWVAAGTTLPLLSGLFLGRVINTSPGFYRSGAVPAVLLIIWSLRHSLQRDGTARSLAHFGGVLFLIGAVASSMYTSKQTVTLKSGDMQEIGDVRLTYNQSSTGGEIRAAFGDTILEVQLTAKTVLLRQLWRDIYISPLSGSDEVLKGHAADPLLSAEVSVVPLMNLVRVGAVLTLFGGLLTLAEQAFAKEL